MDGRFTVDLDGPTTGADRKSVLVIGIADSENAGGDLDDAAECAGSRSFMAQPNRDLDLRRRNIVIVSESVEVEVDILRVMHFDLEAVTRLRNRSIGKLWDVDAVAVKEEHDSPVEGPLGLPIVHRDHTFSNSMQVVRTTLAHAGVGSGLSASGELSALERASGDEYSTCAVPCVAGR